MAFLLHMHIELRPGDVRALLARGVKVVAFQPELLQLVLELLEVHAHIEQRSDEHVSADAAENIEVKSLHHNLGCWNYLRRAVWADTGRGFAFGAVVWPEVSASAFIWLAA